MSGFGRSAIKAWLDHHLRPMLEGALLNKATRHFAGVLISYGIGVARADGMTAAEVRAELVEPALAEVAAD